MPQITRDSHYVPQATLKRWSEDGKNVRAYRLLVSHDEVAPWQPRPIRSIARQRDLYTTTSEDREADEFETYITRNFEEPGQAAIEKLIERSPLSPDEWRDIARFVALQQLRTPLYFLEYIERAGPQIEASLAAVMAEYERIGAIKPSLSGTPGSTFLRDSLRVSISQPPEAPGQLVVQPVVRSSRSMWMDSIRHHLTKNVSNICEHRWRAVEPAGNVEWPITDHPVLNINYHGPDRYDFGGGWGHPGSEFFMPVSPRLAVYTQVGAKATGRFAFTADQTAAVLNLALERAWRWIVFRNPQDLAEVRPREVSAERFAQEQQAWQQWHVMHSDSELEFDALPSA